MTVVTWTDDRVEQLKKLWEAGHSASQIAAELGNVTRNAVIGKVHRLGLSGRAKAATASVPRQRKATRPVQHIVRTAARPVARGNTALAQVFEVEVEADAIAYDNNVVPMGQRISILELNDSTCRWPIGDPGAADFAFCGGKTTTGLPYCSYHCRIAYQPVSDRRRDRRPAGDVR
ncbi:MAG TPA: GcrA family cell cycle regulator [Xanthobacteraceae bacterium]|nr:GcrA family cell cycle regulator [Xanthobacteraceae bacterium]